MTDTSTTSDTLASQTAGLANGFQADPITAAVNAAPELAQSPGAAVTVANSGGGTAAAQGVAQQGNRQSAVSAAQSVSQGRPSGFLSDIGSFLGHDILHPVEQLAQDVMNAANAPMRFVQHEYRYLHDVEATHGMEAAVLEGIGILGAGVGGTLLTGGDLAAGMGAAEGATALLGQVAYRDSWSRTGNPNYRDPHTGKLVSFGHDITHLLSDIPGLHSLKSGGEFSDVSGALDGISWLVADPIGLAGSVRGAALGETGLGGAFADRFPGTRFATTEDVEQAALHNGPFQRAITDIAGMNAGQIISHYPRFGAIASRLGAASTPDDVVDVFRDVTRDAELAKRVPGTLPTLSITRIPFRKIRDAAANSEGRLANNFLLGPRSWADRLEKLPGGGFDPEALNFSSKKIDGIALTGIQNYYAMLRYSESQRTAEDAVSTFINAEPEARKGMYINGVMDVMFGMARMPLPPEERARLGEYLSELVSGDTKQAMLEKLAQYTSGSDPGRTYGLLEDSHPVPPLIPTDGGMRYQAGIFTSQRGSWTIPDFTTMKRMAAELRGARNWLGRIDDFAFENITQPIFKPLILQSLGYAEHISVAEIIPNVLRYGLRTYAKAGYDAAVAKLGWKFDNDELNSLEMYIYRVVRRVPRTERTAQYDAEVFGIMDNGLGVTPGGSAGEAIENETMPPAEMRSHSLRRSASKMPMKTGDDWGVFGPENRRFSQAWHDSLREISGVQEGRIAASTYRRAIEDGLSDTVASERARRGVAAYLNNLPEDVRRSMARSQDFDMEHPPAGWTATDNWAMRIVQHVKSMTTGRSGLLHEDLLRRVADQDLPKVGELDGMDDIDKPALVKGRPLVPDGSGAIQRIAAFGFRHVLNPFVNATSREPLFRLEYIREREGLQKAVDKGIYSEDEAMTIAASRATQHMVRFVHNLHDRTQWTDTLRNWIPFYFAQEQAYRRAGRLLAENPGAFRRYQLMISAVHNIANKQQDSDGNQYIVFPGSGWLGRNVPYISNLLGMPTGTIAPAAFGGSFSAANVIFPLSQGFRPDIGPVVAMPAQAIAEAFPELDSKYSAFTPVANTVTSALTFALGSDTMSQPIWEQLIPNTFVQRVIETATASDNSFNSAFIDTLQALDYQQNLAMDAWRKGGKKGTAPDIVPPPDASVQTMQKFLNQVRNQTRIRFAMRALIGLVSPVSADVEVQNWGLPQTLSDDITRAGSVTAGITTFLEKNPAATPWTVFRSTSTTPGASAPADSTQAEQWINGNISLINTYPSGAMWLMPQLTSNTYSPTVYNEQIAQGLREKQTPQQFLNSLYVAAGNQTYYAALPIHEAALQAANGNSASTQAEYSAWNQWVTTLTQQNPIWASDYYSADKDVYRQQAIQQLTTIFNKGLAPQTQQSALVESLLNNYYVAANQYAQAANGVSYSTQLEDQSAVKDSWIQYTLATEKQYPSLAPIINSVFKDALYSEVPS